MDVGGNLRHVWNKTDEILVGYVEIAVIIAKAETEWKKENYRISYNEPYHNSSRKDHTYFQTFEKVFEVIFSLILLHFRFAQLDKTHVRGNPLIFCYNMTTITCDYSALRYMSHGF